MIPALLGAALFLALFTLFTIRIRAARARVALWRKLAFGAFMALTFVSLRKGRSDA